MKTLNLKITPRFCETDALAHVSNTTLPCWFEQARRPFFEMFVPNLDVRQWNLIVRKIEVEFEAQIFLDPAVEIRSWIGRLGSSSFVVEHEVWQNYKRCARGSAVMIHFDYAQQRPVPVPEAIRQQLLEYVAA